MARNIDAAARSILSKPDPSPAPGAGVRSNPRHAKTTRGGRGGSGGRSPAPGGGDRGFARGAHSGYVYRPLDYLRNSRGTTVSTEDLPAPHMPSVQSPRASLPPGHSWLDLSADGVEGVGGVSSQKVPLLQHGLRRVLFNPGVHSVRDPRDQSERFSPFVSEIHHPRDIDFNAIPPFVTTSRDDTLHGLAIEHGSVVKGSTSSMTSLLSQIYFQLSGFRSVRLDGLSPLYQKLNSDFTRSATAPVSVLLTARDGVYSVDADQTGGVDQGPPPNQILMDLGKSLERMLTTPEEEFRQRFLRGGSKTDEPAAPEAYSFMRVGSTMMRSQLDCYDPELEGDSQFFELKTRATSAIRLDCANYASKTGYRLTRIRGFNFSYEREFYDLIRSAFLKFAFQVRIGRMAGVFVAHHSTQEMFGFEYIPLQEMERYVFGSPALGPTIFRASAKLLDEIMVRIHADHAASGKDLRVVFNADRTSKVLDVFVESLPDDHKLRWSEKHVPGEGYADAEEELRAAAEGPGAGIGGLTAAAAAAAAATGAGAGDARNSPAVRALEELASSRDSHGGDGDATRSREEALKAAIRAYNRPFRPRTRKYTPAEVEELIPIGGTVRHYRVDTRLSVSGESVPPDFVYNAGDRVEVSFKIEEVERRGSGEALTQSMRGSLRNAYRVFDKVLEPGEFGD